MRTKSEMRIGRGEEGLTEGRGGRMGIIMLYDTNERVKDVTVTNNFRTTNNNDIIAIMIQTQISSTTSDSILVSSLPESSLSHTQPVDACLFENLRLFFFHLVQYV